MAEIVNGKTKSKSAPGDDDLEVLHPERTKKIGGINVTVREYGWTEGLRLRPEIKPLMDDLTALMRDDVPGIDVIRALLGKHVDITTKLIAQAADVDLEFLDGLNTHDGELLENMWWSVNGAFFLRKAIDNLKEELLVKSLRDGLISTQNSSPAATEPKT